MPDQATTTAINSQPEAAFDPRRGNCLLAALPVAEMDLLSPHLEPVALFNKLELFACDAPIDHVHFVDRGVASLTTTMNDGVTVEIATVGPEGMVGMPVFFGTDRVSFRAFVQIPGEGRRIAAEMFRELMPRCPSLARLLMRYALALMNQIAQNAACNRAHSVEERCARWLLMTHDRIHDDSFPLTQEFLAQMLGVRRPTVSLAAGMLAKAGLISYVRGQMTILDRTGLEAAACECYRLITREFERLAGEAE